MSREYILQHYGPLPEEVVRFAMENDRMFFKVLVAGRRLYKRQLARRKKS
jgi:hypothetical protein